MTLEPGRRYYMSEIKYEKFKAYTGPHRDKDFAVDEVYKLDELDRDMGLGRISEAKLYSFELDYEGMIVFERDCNEE